MCWGEPRRREFSQLVRAVKPWPRTTRYEMNLLRALSNGHPFAPTEFPRAVSAEARVEPNRPGFNMAAPSGGYPPRSRRCLLMKVGQQTASGERACPRVRQKIVGHRPVIHRSQRCGPIPHERTRLRTPPPYWPRLMQRLTSTGSGGGLTKSLPGRSIAKSTCHGQDQSNGHAITDQSVSGLGTLIKRSNSCDRR